MTHSIQKELKILYYEIYYSKSKTDVQKKYFILNRQSVHYGEDSCESPPWKFLWQLKIQNLQLLDWGLSHFNFVRQSTFRIG